MNIEELARVLYNKASDMDFADYMDTEEETISSIMEELEKGFEGNHGGSNRKDLRWFYG